MTEIFNVRRYATKPHIVDALHWEGTALEGDTVVRWVKGYGGEAEYIAAKPGGPGEHLLVMTYHGSIYALPGDYITKDVYDQFDVRDAITFTATYEETNP